MLMADLFVVAVDGVQIVGREAPRWSSIMTARWGRYQVRELRNVSSERRNLANLEPPHHGDQTMITVARRLDPSWTLWRPCASEE
jgi:hypothetical protein